MPWNNHRFGHDTSNPESRSTHRASAGIRRWRPGWRRRPAPASAAARRGGDGRAPGTCAPACAAVRRRALRPGPALPLARRPPLLPQRLPPVCGSYLRSIIIIITFQRPVGSHLRLIGLWAVYNCLSSCHTMLACRSCFGSLRALTGSEMVSRERVLSGCWKPSQSGTLPSNEDWHCS